MGGRGSVSGFVSRAPNAGKATIADAKVTKFLLDPTKKHYAEFAAVGYSRDDPDRLKRDLLDGLQNNDAKMYNVNASGNRPIEVDMMLGVTRKARFRTAWQIDRGTDFPRFISAYRIGVNRK